MVSSREIGAVVSETAVSEGAIVVDQLIRQIGTSRFELWFDSRKCISILDDVATVFAQSSFAVERIRQLFADEIERAIDTAIGREISVIYLVADLPAGNPDCDHAGSIDVSPKSGVKRSDAPRKPSSSSAGTSRKSSLDSQRPSGPPAAPLEDFHFSASNRLVQSAVKQLFASPGLVTPLYVCGPVGSGKTHLLRAITAGMRSRNRSRSVYLSAEQFTSQFLEALQGRGLPVFRGKYRDLDLLAIDDVHFFQGKKATLLEFQHTLDSLMRQGKQIVVSGDRLPRQMEKSGAEVITRMSAGLVCSLEYPDEATRQAVLRTFCQQRGYEIDESAILSIARRFPGDVRQLSGAVNRVSAAAAACGEPIDEDFIDRTVGDLQAGAHPTVSMSEIEKAVCKVCGLNRGELKSPRRTKNIRTARLLAIWLSRKHTGSAFSEIGQFFGGRTHSTAIAAEKRVKRLVQNRDQIELANRRMPISEAIHQIETHLRVG